MESPLWPPSDQDFFAAPHRILHDGWKKGKSGVSWERERATTLPQMERHAMEDQADARGEGGGERELARLGEKKRYWAEVLNCRGSEVSK